ncbi:hypothetical protein C3B59_05810 [Cryobacterium zongtaii]|uniref:Uncharacterized protein n=1 Tax=Cryobacterium zongtaii TaxID=1259217 RepID=A0A2S3ZLB9_9MICO|nr:hypothetical protein [Cryobacterium zongtaii]POH69153.1 hypothetical protein C3B59_05810 [Cryobacterium zongtaii]
MRFIKLAVTTYEHDRTRPVLGVDEVWINLDQVVSIQEQLDSNTFADAVRMGITPEEHYPCVELSMSNGTTRLLSLGVYGTQSAGFDAIARFLPALISDGATADDQLEQLLTESPTWKAI